MRRQICACAYVCVCLSGREPRPGNGRPLMRDEQRGPARRVRTDTRNIIMIASASAVCIYVGGFA